MKATKLYRAAALILTVGGLFALLYLGKPFLIPLSVAGLLAMMLSPVDNWLRDKGLPRGIAIAVSVLLLVAIIGGVFTLLGYQSQQVFDDLDRIEARAAERVDDLQDVVENRVGITLNTDFKVEQYADRILRSTATFLRTLVSSLSLLLLTLVYLILFLLEKERIRRFLVYLAPDERRAEMRTAAGEVAEVSRKYLYGKGIVTLILGALYGLGFWLADLPFAFMLALIGALLAIIPYIGNLIAAGVAALIIIATGGSTEQLLWLAGIMTAAQLLESYVLTPIILGDEVSLNGLITVVAVVGFGALWGPAGAILGIPIVGMVKAAFEHVDTLRPYAYLLGTRKELDAPVNGS